MYTIKYIPVLLVIFWASISTSLAQLNINSYTYFGGSGLDENPSLSQTPDGGYLLAFESTSTDEDCIGNHGSRDIVIIKLDANRNRVWSRCYGGTYNEKLGDIFIDDLGQIYVCGTTESIDGDLPPERKGSADRWVFKLHPDGTIIWSKVYGGSNVDYGTWISQKPNNKFVVGGTSLSRDKDVPNNYGKDDSWVIEIDENGKLLQSLSYGCSEADRDFAGIATRDNGFLAGIRVLTDDGAVVGPDHGLEDLWFVKCDDEMTIEWQAVLGGWDSDDNIGDMIEVADGYIFMAETASGDFTLENAHCVSSYNTSNVFICKINQMGISQWARCITSSIPYPDFYTYYEKSNFGKSLFPSDDGGVIVFSQSYQDNCTIQTGLFYPHSILVSKLTATGGLQWQAQLGSFSQFTVASYEKIAAGVWLGAIQSDDFQKGCEEANQGFANNDIWLAEFVDCNDYKATLPEGDQYVCINTNSITQYTTQAAIKPNLFSWSLSPFDAGLVGSNDSTTTIEWSPSFSGEAYLSVSLVTECGYSQPSDSLLINVHRDCTGIDDFLTESVKVSFYPNPASQSAILHYSLPEGITIARVHLYDMNGREVLVDEVTASEKTKVIDISRLSRGIYQCTVEEEKARGRCRLVVL